MFTITLGRKQVVRKYYDFSVERADPAIDAHNKALKDAKTPPPAYHPDISGRDARDAQERAEAALVQASAERSLIFLGSNDIPTVGLREAVGSMKGFDLSNTTDQQNIEQTLTTYPVKAGDTLSAIAQTKGTTVAELLKINPGINPNLIKPGQVINISGEAPVATAIAPASSIAGAPTSAPAPRVAVAPAARPAAKVAAGPKSSSAPDRPRGEGEVKSYTNQLEEARKDLATARAGIAMPNVLNKEPYNQMIQKAEAQIKTLEPLAKQELAMKEAQEKYAKKSPNERLLADYSESLRLVMQKRVSTPSKDSRQEGWKKEEVQLRSALASVNTLIQNDKAVADYKGEIKGFGNRADRGPQTAELNKKIQELEGRNNDILVGLNKIPDPLNPTRLAQYLHPKTQTT